MPNFPFHIVNDGCEWSDDIYFTALLRTVGGRVTYYFIPLMTIKLEK